jgi:hypothetical protein
VNNRPASNKTQNINNYLIEFFGGGAGASDFYLKVVLTSGK